MTLQKFQKQYFLEDYAENIEVSKMRIIKKRARRGIAKQSSHKKRNK